jgi:hypothetical protein
MCTAVLIGRDPATPPPTPSLPPHLGSYKRALLVSQDRRHHFVTHWQEVTKRKVSEWGYEKWADNVGREGVGEGREVWMCDKGGALYVQYSYLPQSNTGVSLPLRYILLKYQQTEKIETELKDVDRIHRIRKVYASWRSAGRAAACVYFK